MRVAASERLPKAKGSVLLRGTARELACDIVGQGKPKGPKRWRQAEGLSRIGCKKRLDDVLVFLAKWGAGTVDERASPTDTRGGRHKEGELQRRERPVNRGPDTRGIEVPGNLGVAAQGAHPRAGCVDKDGLEALVERLRKAGRVQLAAIEADAPATCAKPRDLEAPFCRSYLTLVEFNRYEL